MSTTATTIGPYVLERELGRGAFGVVYLGHHEDRPDERLAIKTIETLGNVDRTLVEPALLARLKHPCVVGLEDYFVADGKLVLALEFVPGDDLKGYLDRGEHFPPEKVRDLLAQVGSALAEAHAQQIVHRDIKPSNILVDTTGGRTRYVLTDFGVGRKAEGLQAEKNVGGTFLYMAPEQLRGRPGPQSDLWALGVVAYELLAGKLPFPGPTVGELAKQIQYTDPPPPSEVTGTPLPADLESAVLGLLRKSLSERTGSAAELLAQLGVRGDTKNILDSSHDTKRTTSKPAVPFAQTLARRARRATWLLAIMILLYILENTVIQAIVFLSGLWLFYYAQSADLTRARRAGLTALSFGILAFRYLGAFIPKLGTVLTLGQDKWGTWLSDQAKQAASGPQQEFWIPMISMLITAVTIVSVFIPVVAAAAYSRIRRARREQALLKAALAGETGSDEFLALMKKLLDTRFEDVGFHLRYAELLYARGDHRQAAVEARLITVQDPYHFNANLLLANAYYTLRLYDDCRRVCDDYLAVAGYCFEFQELRQLCAGRAAP